MRRGSFFMRHRVRMLYVMLLASIVTVVSYIANIVKLIGSDVALAEFTVVEILRCVGIFVPPLGVIMGFI